jgi:anti-anti-sigma factor
MPNTLFITETESGKGTIVLRVQGELDALTTPALLKRCQAVRTKNKHLVLNLSGVTFIASNGIGGLLSTAEDFRESKLSFRIAAPSPAVDSVIKLLNLHPFLNIDSSEDAALNALEAA